MVRRIPDTIVALTVCPLGKLYVWWWKRGEGGRCLWKRCFSVSTRGLSPPWDSGLAVRKKVAAVIDSAVRILLLL